MAEDERRGQDESRKWLKTLGQAGLWLLTVIVAAVVGAVVNRYFSASDKHALEQQIAAVRRVATAAQAQAVAARDQVAVLNNQAATQRTQSTFSIASDLRDQLNRIEDQLTQTATKSGAKPCLSVVLRKEQNERHPADVLFLHQNYVAAAKRYTQVILDTQTRAQRCDPGVKLTIKHLPPGTP